MATKDGEKRTSVKLRESTIQMVRETGISGDTIDELVRRLLFRKNTGSSEETDTDKKIKRLL